MQQAIGAALAGAVRGATATCTVTPVSGGGQAIRVTVSLPNQPDAVIVIAAPSAASGLHDVTAALGLGSPAYNVAHYALGTGNGGSGYRSQSASAAGEDGSGLPDTADLIGDQGAVTGIYALDKVALFNLLSIPDATRALPGDPAALDPAVDPVAIYGQAIAYCDQRRAFLLADPPPEVTTVAGAVDWISARLGLTDPNGAAFWPRLRAPDPVNGNKLRTFAPSGVVAGVYATTDGSRGVWKAPAGIGATLAGVQSLAYTMTDSENGLLNPIGLNCLRAFPSYGRVLWGARTLQGADAEASQWKYVPVRRLALFLEQSLYQGLQWVVFEPNDAPLWAAIRLNVESFMQTLFRKGAFQGTTPDQAYLVKCDSETTTQADIDNGIVNILVGFAPLKPAEFVVIQIEQLTGQASS
jgi:phage tail sheath protein FI